jgi:hypothetical protein
MVPNLFDSPAVPLLVALEDQGFELAVKADGRLRVAPGSRLTVDQRRQLVEHKVAVLMILRLCDAGVGERRDVFRRQLDAVGAPVVPAFLFRLAVPYIASLCFSCGEANGREGFGRCWRCSLAWRLAVGLPIPPDFGAAYDTAKRVA